jgi:hypothetical protein
MSKISTHIPEPPENTTNLSESETHRLLSDDRRRLALEILDERTTGTTLDSLASEVVRRESGVDASDVSATERVRISLHHNHLPLLSDMGVVEYDATSQHIEL